MEQNNYLGTEKVGVLLRRFAIPCIFSLIISCLYNIVDQIFVGNGVGYLGNAATGVIFPITVIPGTRGERIWNAPIWPGQPITEIYPGKNGATPINMSFASTAPSESKSVRMLSPRMY